MMDNTAADAATLATTVQIELTATNAAQVGNEEAKDAAQVPAPRGSASAQVEEPVLPIQVENEGVPAPSAA